MRARPSLFDLGYDGDDRVVCDMCRRGMDQVTFVLVGGRLMWQP